VAAPARLANPDLSACAGSALFRAPHCPHSLVRGPRPRRKPDKAFGAADPTHECSGLRTPRVAQPQIMRGLGALWALARARPDVTRAVFREAPKGVAAPQFARALLFEPQCLPGLSGLSKAVAHLRLTSPIRAGLFRPSSRLGGPGRDNPAVPTSHDPRAGSRTPLLQRALFVADFQQTPYLSSAAVFAGY
jgi:hypothetical protein